MMDPKLVTDIAGIVILALVVIWQRFGKTAAAA
jgi:hypothetical protein